MSTASVDTKDRILHGDCLEVLPTLPERSVDLVLGSPPYCDARTYDDGTLPEGHIVSRNCRDWVEWMIEVTDAALRVSRGAVVWVASGVTRDRNYWPACEGLMWEWYIRGGHAYRPCYWFKGREHEDGPVGNGLPGSGGNDWFRQDIEYVMCFKRPGELPWADNTAMGKAPKWAPGGDPSHRMKNGRRVARLHTKQRPDGTMETQGYNPPPLSNPGNLVFAPVGGGHIGDRLAHENEAPYPEKLAEHFIRSLCPPGGIVCDPFSGSGTTAKVAKVTGRRALAIDVRGSQVNLTQKRLSSEAALIRELFD